MRQNAPSKERAFFIDIVRFFKKNKVVAKQITNTKTNRYRYTMVGKVAGRHKCRLYLHKEF